MGQRDKEERIHLFGMVYSRKAHGVGQCERRRRIPKTEETGGQPHAMATQMKPKAQQGRPDYYRTGRERGNRRRRLESSQDRILGPLYSCSGI